LYGRPTTSGKAELGYGLPSVPSKPRRLDAPGVGRMGRPEPTPDARKALLSQSRVESEKSFS